MGLAGGLADGCDLAGAVPAGGAGGRAALAEPVGGDQRGGPAADDAGGARAAG